MLVVALAFPVLLGTVALCSDVAVLYYNWMQLQKAADAAVLAGANYLPDNPSQAVTTADQIAEDNRIKVAEITSTTVSEDNQSITIKLKRTVPYYFGRVLGLTTAPVHADASAGASGPPTTVNASTPQQVPAGGDNNGANGSVCGSTGICGLVPIGLDSGTAFSNGAQITLQLGQLGPGNWDLLALGMPGGAELRTNIANGFNSMISVGDWLTTKTGRNVGPVDQGFQDRLNAAQSVDPLGTYLSHTMNDPRVLIVPVVDWEHPNGRSKVEVKGFATLWLDSYSRGKATVNFINQVIPNSFGTPGAPSWGALGWPTLTH